MPLWLVKTILIVTMVIPLAAALVVAALGICWMQVQDSKEGQHVENSELHA